MAATLQLLAGVLFVSVVAGGITAYISQLWTYVIVLFPIAGGMLIGFAGRHFALKLQMRHAMAAIAIAALSGFAWFGSLQYGDYLKAKSILMEAAADPDLTPLLEMPSEERQSAITSSTELSEDNKQSMLRFFEMLEAVSSFPTFLVHTMSEEMSITNTGHGDRPMNIGVIGGLLVNLLEIGLVGWMVGLMLLEVARKPFCQETKSWKQESSFRYFGDPTPLMTALKAGDFNSFREALFATSDGEAGVVKTYMSPRSGGASTIDVAMYRLERNNKGHVKEKQILFMSFDPDARVSVEDIVAHVPTTHLNFAKGKSAA